MRRNAGSGSLLYEMSREASGVATAMSGVGSMVMFATVGGDIVLHTYQSVCMMMVGNDRDHQHDQADEEKKYGYVLSLFHSFIFVWAQR